MVRNKVPESGDTMFMGPREGAVRFSCIEWKKGLRALSCKPARFAQKAAWSAAISIRKRSGVKESCEVPHLEESCLSGRIWRRVYDASKRCFRSALLRPRRAARTSVHSRMVWRLVAPVTGCVNRRMGLQTLVQN